MPTETRNTALIDSHAHLDFERFDEDRLEVLERARQLNVDTIVSIGTDLASSRRALALADEHEMIYASAGVHPHQADDFPDEDWEGLCQLWAHPRVLGIGETGLDYFYDYSDRSRQRSLFARHLEVAARHHKPVIIHIRDAFDDAFSLIERHGVPAGGVVHCFTGGPSECERVLALGLHISLSGIVTFKNAKALREATPLIPLDKLLVETDSPFLAPVPHRGRRNEPAYVVETAREVAKLRGQSLETIAQATRENTVRLFKMPA